MTSRCAWRASRCSSVVSEAERLEARRVGRHRQPADEDALVRHHPLGRLNVGGSRFGRICTSRRLSAACRRASASLGVVTASAVLAIARIEAKKRCARHPLLPRRLSSLPRAARRAGRRCPIRPRRRAAAASREPHHQRMAYPHHVDGVVVRAAPPGRVCRRAPRRARCGRDAPAPASARSSGRSTRWSLSGTSDAIRMRSSISAPPGAVQPAAVDDGRRGRAAGRVAPCGSSSSARGVSDRPCRRSRSGGLLRAHDASPTSRPSVRRRPSSASASRTASRPRRSTRPTRPRSSR